VEKEMEQKGWLGCIQSKGWFDGQVAKIWIEKVMKPYLEDAEESFLLIDHYKVHMTSDFVKACNNLGADVNYIPAGYTCVLQPLDVGVNGPFKAFVRDHIHSWVLQKYPGLANHGKKFPTPEQEDVYPWILLAFQRITSESIVCTFACIGLTHNSLQEEEVETDQGPLDDEADRVDVDDAELAAEDYDDSMMTDFQFDLVGVEYTAKE